MEERSPSAVPAGAVDLGLDDAVAWYLASFLTAEAADALFDELSANLAWSQHAVRVMGRLVAQPRLTCWYGDAGTTYTYSGLTLEPRRWTPALADLRAQVEQASGTRFGAVLGNLYRDGRDSVAWHSDDEAELGPEPVIASVSLGASRRFDLRRRSDHSQRRSIELEHGSLLVMSGPTQRHWQHQVPKTRCKVGARINLTFRTRVAPVRAGHPG